MRAPKTRAHVQIKAGNPGEHYSWTAWTEGIGSWDGNCADRRNIAQAARETISQALDIPQHRIEVVVHR